MPKVVYSGAERLRMNAILDELDPATSELTTPFQDVLSEDDWNFVVTYARNEMRAALEIGMLTRAVAEAARDRAASNEEGVAAFFEAVSCMRNFGVSDRTDERFRNIADVDSPLFIAVDALLQMAQDRLFNTLDEEYVRLLREQLGR